MDRRHAKGLPRVAAAGVVVLERGDGGIDLAIKSRSIRLREDQAEAGTRLLSGRYMPSQFEQLAATLDYPLYVVTTAVQNEPAGCLIGFATQCSIDPPRFLACISNKNHTLLLARRATTLGVHIIEEKDRDIAEIFGGETGDEVDKFARVSWHYVHGVPKLDACQRWFAGKVLTQIDFGDHVGFLLEPIDAEQNAPSEQLTFQQAKDIEPGHEP